MNEIDESIIASRIIKELQAERDRILQLLAKERLAFAWKECELEKDRDTWRALAEGLADKLKEAIHKDSRHEMKDFGKTITYCQTRERVEEALAAFDAAKRGTK